eukprot:1299888-Pleurochrysis_carterae.AAC.1
MEATKSDAFSNLMNPKQSEILRELVAKKIKVTPVSRRATRLANQRQVKQAYSDTLMSAKLGRESARLRRLRQVGQRRESIKRRRQQCDATGDESQDAVSRSVCGARSK